MIKLFKGYLPTKNKECTRKFKNNADALFSLEEIQRFVEYAGVLDYDTVLIDIDNFEDSEILFKIVTDLKLNCVVYKTTKGKHFYFKNLPENGLTNNKTKETLAISIKSDIKLGIKNSYAILRFDNKDREILYQTDSIQEVPKWLYPIGKKDLDFQNMAEGDGRNQSLFNYILTLQQYDFTIEEIRECIRIINKYVLKNPLKDSELETILRDEAFDSPIFFKGNTFLFDKFANYIKTNNHIIKLNGRLHVYNNGIYTDGYGEIEKIMLKHIPLLTKNRRKEVLSYLELIVNDNLKEADSNLIAFKNGIYNLFDDSFMEFNPEIVITNMIPHAYNPDAECELVDNVLMKISNQNKDIFNLLCECVGYCFYRRNELGKAFLLNGGGSNGKSTFIDMVKTLLSEKNISSLDLSELGDRFKTAELYGKLANLGDDIGDEFVRNTSFFKKLVTGDRMTAERKGQDPFQFSNYSKFLFSANNIPRMSDKTGAVLRRLIIIPFEAKFSKNDPDYRPFIKYDLRKPEAIERLIVLALQGLKRVLENNCFTSCEKVENSLSQYEIENNSIINFVNDFGLENIINEQNTLIYSKYCEFCIENGLRETFSKISFLRQLYSRYTLTAKNRTVNGKLLKIIVKDE